MQSLCAHGKEIGDASMSKEAPVVKKLLEEFIFRYAYVHSRSGTISPFSLHLSGGCFFRPIIVDLQHALILHFIALFSRCTSGYNVLIPFSDGHVNRYLATHLSCCLLEHFPPVDQIPCVRHTLRVRSLVQSHDCLGAMTVGKLKNRGLDGELVVARESCRIFVDFSGACFIGRCFGLGCSWVLLFFFSLALQW